MDNKPKKLAVEMAKLSISEGSYKETTVRNVEQKWNVIFCDSAKCNISEKIYLIWHAYFHCFFLVTNLRDAKFLAAKVTSESLMFGRLFNTFRFFAGYYIPYQFIVLYSPKYGLTNWNLLKII